MAADKRPTTFDLFVGNLPLTITGDVLMQSFQQFGPVSSVQILDGSRDDSKRGFVRFLNQQSVELALAKPIYINSYKITCKLPNRVGWKTQTSVAGQNSGSGGSHFTTSRHGSDDGLDPAVRLSFGSSDSQNRRQIQNKKQLRILMTHVESPTMFWAQNVEKAGIVENLQASLSNMCPDLPFIRTKPDLEKFYGTQFSLDDQWYRCEVCRYVKDNQSEVLYVDYGNREIVSNSTIVELPEALVQMDALASKYCLYGVKPVNDQKLFALGVDKLSRLKDTSLLDAVICEQSNDEAIAVMLKTVSGVDVIEEMLKSKSCVPVADHKYQQSLPKDPAPLSRGGTPTDTAPNVPKLMESKFVDGSGDNCFDPKDVLAKEVEKFRKEKVALEGAIQTLRKDSDETKHELKLCREKFTMQNNEFLERNRILQEQKQTAEKELAWMSENTITKRIGRVFSKVRNLSLLRAQYDSDTKGVDFVEEAIALASENSLQTSLNAEPLFAKIDAVRKKFQSLQTDLLRASEGTRSIDSAALDQLIADRNDAKQELYSSLREFVAQFLDLETLTSTVTKIEKILSTVQSKYSSSAVLPIMNKLNADDSFKEYLCWKKMKAEEIENSRRLTEKQHSLVLEGLKTLQGELLHHLGTVDLKEPSVPDIEQLFKDFEAAVDNEIKLMSQNESQSDGEICRKTLASISSILNGNLENIRKLIDRRVQYAEESEEMSVWLENTPDISQLQTTMKTVKRLKSKLRHRLVDLQDMEEDDPNSVELIEVKEDLEKIRELLQEHLEEEDKQLELLAHLAVKHFPELIFKHPEFNLRKVINYNGILKSDYILDQFRLSPLPGANKRDIHQSLCCGKPILIKKYLIGTSDRDEFLRRMKEYSDISCPFLPRIMAVFFEMNEWQAVVVRPLFDLNLAQFVEMELSGNPQKISKARIIACVLQGLDALHCGHLVHGSVNPNNVLIDLSLGGAVLSDYDFTRVPSQRTIENPYVTASGLKFLAPELDSSSSLASDLITASSDMYNFGLLILWLYSPTVSKASNNVDDLCSDSIDSDTATLISVLLHDQPQGRPGTDKILEAGYFRLTDDDDFANDAEADKTDSCPEGEKPKGDAASDAEDENSTSSSVNVKTKEADVEKGREEIACCEDKKIDRNNEEFDVEGHKIKEKINSELEETSTESSTRKDDIPDSG